jgi:GDP-D-mannose dehydratase
LNDPLAMRTVMATVRPDRNFHLAAQSFVSARHPIIVKREVGI